MKFVKKKSRHPGFGMRNAEITQPEKNPGIDGPKEFHAEQALIFVSLFKNEIENSFQFPPPIIWVIFDSPFL